MIGQVDILLWIFSLQDVTGRSHQSTVISCLLLYPFYSLPDWVSSLSLSDLNIHFLYSSHQTWSEQNCLGDTRDILMVYLCHILLIVSIFKNLSCQVQTKVPWFLILYQSRCLNKYKNVDYPWDLCWWRLLCYKCSFFLQNFISQESFYVMLTDKTLRTYS